MKKSAAIIIGASGGLGLALCKEWQKDNAIGMVIAISRSDFPPDESNDESNDESSLHHIHCDYSEASIVNNCVQIKTLMKDSGIDVIARVCICNGILHNENIWPEKRIEDISVSAMQEIFTINSIVPLLWLKALVSIVNGQHNCMIAVFSARIGSIGDNRTGGWYSYRASKAALNMLLKTAAIEYQRRAKNVKLIAFHPGTTDTNLSKPFQRSVKQGNLLTAQYVADHLVRIMNTLPVDGKLSFIDWENKTIVW